MTEAAATRHQLPADPPAIAPERDLLSKFDPLIAEREALLATGVRDPFAIVMDEVKSPTLAIIKGRETILLGTYNYMGMTFDPDVVQAGKDALDAFGSGTTGSRVLNGTYGPHKDCEEALKEFYGTSSAMVFSTGYQANLGIISTLAGKGEYIILDADSHASIYDGCALGNAEIVRFRHNSVEDLDKRLGRLPEGVGQARRAGGRLFDVRRHRSAARNGGGRQEARVRWCWSMRRTAWASSARTRPRRVRGAGRRRRTSISWSAPSPSRSAPSAVSASPIIPKFEVMRLVCRPYVFTASACRRRWWRPPPRRSAS